MRVCINHSVYVESTQPTQMQMHITFKLSMFVLNSRDQQGKLWLPTKRDLKTNLITTKSSHRSIDAT